MDAAAVLSQQLIATLKLQTVLPVKNLFYQNDHIHTSFSIIQIHDIHFTAVYSKEN